LTSMWVIRPWTARRTFPIRLSINILREDKMHNVRIDTSSNTSKLTIQLRSQP
jgi:hypothetical protein